MSSARKKALKAMTKSLDKKKAYIGELRNNFSITWQYALLLLKELNIREVEMEDPITIMKPHHKWVECESARFEQLREEFARANQKQNQRVELLTPKLENEHRAHMEALVERYQLEMELEQEAM